MSLKPIPCYTAICDWLDCSADVCEASDYSGWDLDGIENEIDHAIDYGWHRGPGKHELYCDKHPTFDADEVEEAEPKRPYLLRDDDDHVRLVMDALEDPRQLSLLDEATS